MIAYIQTPIAGKTGLGPLDAGGPKIVWHTTEGGNADAALMERFRSRDLASHQRMLDGVLNYYRGPGYVPHFTVDAQLRVVHQHLPYDTAGYALEDQPGGIRPNRAGRPCIQFEQIGHAEQIRDEMSVEDWQWMGDWLRQLCAEAGVPYHFITPWVPYPASYGTAAGQRMTGAQFTAFTGICGHQHVAENVHGDPGDIDLGALTALPAPPTPPTSGDDDMAMYVSNSETRVVGDASFTPPGRVVVYAINGDGSVRHVKEGEFIALKAERRAVTPLSNALLDDLGA